MSENKKRRPKITRDRRHSLAIRDGLAYWLWGPRGPMWVYRCTVCKQLIRPRELTGGHIRALADGGTSASENLRAECVRCNGLENIDRTVKHPEKARMKLERALVRSKEKRLAKATRPKIFDNISVFWDGRLLSRTSERRAREFVRLGRAAWGSNGSVTLLLSPSGTEPARTEPIPNVCVRCGRTADLRAFFIYPSWHPLYRPTRITDQVRPACIHCYELMEIGYAVEITRIAQPILERMWVEFRLAQEQKATLLEAWSRLKAGKEIPESLVNEAARHFALDPRQCSVSSLRSLADQATGKQRAFQVQIVEAIADNIMDARMDFPLLFERLVRGEINPSLMELPRIPLAVVS